MNNIKGILCDLDGTLVNTEIVQLQAWKEIIEKHGRQLPPNWQLRYIGHPDSEMAEYCCTIFDGLPAPEELLRRRHEHYRGILEKLGERIRFPGVLECLTTLRESGMSLAIGTNSPLENASVVMRIAGLDGLFDAVVAFGMAKRGKPGPDIFVLAAKKLELEPEECIVIEDTASGVQAGIAAGCQVIAVTNTCSGSELYRADMVFSTTAEALKWIHYKKQQKVGCDLC